MRTWLGIGLVALGATISACSDSGGVPTSPSAATGGPLTAAADGSTLKSAAPRLVSPVSGASASNRPALLAEPAVGRYATVAAATTRFHLSEAPDFGTLTDDGVAMTSPDGRVRYSASRVQRAGARVFWRARAELDGAVGPWSPPAEFVISGTATSAGVRTPNPPAGQRLPLPDVRGLIAQWTAERPDLFPSQQCPLGVKYVNSPWQDYIVDRLRQLDTRWGYNAKPTRGPADNGGRAVVAAGDEVLYNFGSNADQGNTNEVYAVDILEQHCGTPRLTWRVFTGEEPVRWTGAGRF